MLVSCQFLITVTLSPVDTIMLSSMEGEWKKHNANKLCSMKYADSLCGFLTFKSVPCKVTKK